MNRSVVYRLLALLLASNYFAFQVELFDEEYDANHRSVSNTPAVGSPTVTWETFDKSNAPKAFVLRVDVVFEPLQIVPLFVIPQPLPYLPYQPVRDKSPPAAAPFNA